MKYLNLVLLLLVGFSAVCLAGTKPQYGGTLKVAVDLLENIDREQLFDASGADLHSLAGIPFTLTGATLVVDFSDIDPTAQLEIEQFVRKLQDSSNRCHWIVDYPYFAHHHSTTASFESGELTLQSTEPDFVRVVAASDCLVPEHFKALSPFRKTQFAFEANPNCFQGRPFINSIIPVSVDPANPYLSFKLGDVDVFEVPEDRVGQISKDSELTLMEGPRFYVFLRTSRLTPEQAAALASALNLAEISKAVLNNHAEILLPTSTDVDVSSLSGMTLRVEIPREEPFHLLGERMIVQWNLAGVATTVEPLAGESPAVELVVKQLDEIDFDAFRYLLMRTDGEKHGEQAWFDGWDEMETEGKLTPLLTYTSRIAARKNIQDLKILADGAPDFANCWIQTP